MPKEKTAVSQLLLCHKEISKLHAAGQTKITAKDKARGGDPLFIRSPFGPV